MIIIKSPDEIERMRGASKVVADTLKKISKIAKVGTTTLELDKVAEEFIIENSCKPAFKGYRGFPNSLCVSINEEVVHGIPSIRKLKGGDLLSLDLGVYLNGYYGDAAITIGVGCINENAKRLLKCAEGALKRGIEFAVEGRRLSDISHAIQCHAEKSDFSVVRSFVGHGIGISLHEEPQVPNYGKPGQGPVLKNGMVLAIEPMVNMLGSGVNVLDDNWTVITADGALSAHFEHTVAITKNGPEILTVCA